MTDGHPVWCNPFVPLPLGNSFSTADATPSDINERSVSPQEASSGAAFAKFHIPLKDLYEFGLIGHKNVPFTTLHVEPFHHLVNRKNPYPQPDIDGWDEAEIEAILSERRASDDGLLGSDGFHQRREEVTIYVKKTFTTPDDLEDTSICLMRGSLEFPERHRETETRVFSQIGFYVR